VLLKSPFFGHGALNSPSGFLVFTTRYLPFTDVLTNPELYIPGKVPIMNIKEIEDLRYEVQCAINMLLELESEEGVL